MQEERAVPVPPRTSPFVAHTSDPNTSGVSWAAIFAGAAAAAALSLILVILGFGLGLSAVSPWSATGATAATVGISTIIWLLVTQIIASGLGGYLAGRLRVKWSDLHRDEVHFRDTAHGMLSWAIATLVTAAFLGSALTGIVGGGAKVAGTAASAAVMGSGAMAAQAADNTSGGSGGDSSNGMMSYFVDSLFRSDQPTATENPSQTRAEATTILVNSVRTGTLSDADKTYLGKLVAQRTSLSQADAEKRVSDLYAQSKQKIEDAKNSAKEAADTARKSAAAAALWVFVALLCGAFFASLAAVWGGRRRDAVMVEGRTVR